MTRQLNDMISGGVLIIGSSDAAAYAGLKADERTVAALQVPAATVSTGSASRNAENFVDEVVIAAPTVLRAQIDHATRSIDYKVVKIGAILSEEAIKIASEILQRSGTELISVVDVEPFFKTSPTPPKPELVTALRKELLPSITLLSATVPEVMQLLENADIPADYPRGIPDVQALAKSVAQKLGPQYVIIKREFVDEEDGATTLHYVLVGGIGADPPVMATYRFENPKRVFGASYSICSAIAAYLARGCNVPGAVSAGFEFIGEMLKKGFAFPE